MARDPWIIRTYAGFGDARQSNQRYRDNLARGQRGLSVAFDLPTQCGYDPDHPLAAGEVGKTGVSIAHLGDMRELFADIDLSAINTSMTINATAPWLYALYVALADERGVSREILRGTTQNDLLKEFVARGTYIFAPEASLRLTTDLICESVAQSPRWNPINCCGYHLMESGAKPEEEVGYAMAGAILVLDSVAERLDRERFERVIKAISFFINSGIELVPEIAKVRAYAKIWPDLVEQRYGVRPRFRAGCQVRSLTLTAQQPEVNIVRIALQALPVLMSADARVGALQLPGFREALGLPHEGEQVLSLRTQQVLMHETGIAQWPDIFAGSHVIEAETTRIMQAATAIVQRAVAEGYTATIDRLASLLSERVAEFQSSVESGDRVVVGVNRFQQAVPIATEGDIEHEAVGARAEDRSSSLQRWREKRDETRWRQARQRLLEAAATGVTVVEPSVAFARAGGTTGEWTDAMVEAVGPRYVASLGTDSSAAQVPVHTNDGPPRRVLLAKAGLDGHVNALRLLAVGLRDAGIEVIYTGPGQTPEAIAAAAVQESIDVIGISSLSGNHRRFVQGVHESLRRRDAADITVLLGGIVPPHDHAWLQEHGVAHIFGPGTKLATIVEAIARG